MFTDSSLNDKLMTNSILSNLFMLLSNHKYFLFIFFVLCVELLSNVPLPGAISSYIATPYMISYDFGFGPRLFIGSILQLFTDYVSIYVLWAFIFISTIFLCVLTSICLEKVILKTTLEYRFPVIVLITLFLLSPASISYFFYAENYGRFDLYLLILSIISILFLKNKCLSLLIPIVCVVCMAIHQIYLCTFAPLILLILLYKIYQTHFSKYWVILFIITILSVIISFVYFQFFASINVQSASELISIIENTTNQELSIGALDAAFFMSTTSHLSTYGVTLPRVVSGIITLILISPLIVLFYIFWMMCINRTSNSTSKILYLVFLLSPLASLPAFIIAIDWGRWFAAILIIQFSLVFYLIYQGDSAMNYVVNVFGNFIKKYYILLFAIILLLVSIGHFMAAVPLPIEKYIIHIDIIINTLFPIF